MRSDPATLITATMESSLVTHADLRAGVFAFAVAYSVARLVDGDALADVVTVLPAAVRGVEDSWTLPRHPNWERDQGAPHAVSDAMREIFHAFPQDRRHALRPEDLRDRVCLHALPHVPKKSHAPLHVNSPFVLLGGLHALSMALLCSAEPKVILSEIAAQGGKSLGLVGAIAGTVLGARHGTGWVSDVPERVEKWAEAVARGVPIERRDAFVRGG
jgi:ADP-ribosylglycohydrolase